MTDPLSDLVAEANARGLLVNNLFQLHVGGNLVWQANFCAMSPSEDCSVFARDRDMGTALKNAYDHAVKVQDVARSRSGRGIVTPAEERARLSPKQIDLEEAIAATPSPSRDDNLADLF